jgi:hypothetical protein
MSSSKRSRRHFTTEQKVAILKRHMRNLPPAPPRSRRTSTEARLDYSTRLDTMARHRPPGALLGVSWRSR